MSTFRDKSFTEQVGAVVLFPFKLILLVVVAALLLPLTIVSYPFVAVAVLVKTEGSFGHRARMAALWPLYWFAGLLAFNDFMSLGGMDNRTLSRINDWLKEREWSRKDRKQARRYQ